VVEDVADLWAMERSNVFKGRYHVLGGTLSALDDIGPEDLHIPTAGGPDHLRRRERGDPCAQCHRRWPDDRPLHRRSSGGHRASVTSLAQGVPIGGELDYLDDGTISAALKARKAL
jgi:recombination protein RecR